MSHSGTSGIGPPSGDAGRGHYQQYGSDQRSHHSGDGSERRHARSPGAEQQNYNHQQSQSQSQRHHGDREERRTTSGKHPEEYRKSRSDKESRHRQGHGQSDGRSAQPQQYEQPKQTQQTQQQYATTTGQMRSGHLELDSLYSGDSGSFQVNSMNAPNNSTVQCGCENIDCPFCNLMLSVQMKE